MLLLSDWMVVVGRAVPGGLGGGDAVGGEAVAERLGGGGVRN